MRRTARLIGLILLLTPGVSLADGSTDFPYTLAELEEMVDSSSQVQLMKAKQEETRRKESVWHDISISAGFNPVRTAGVSALFLTNHTLRAADPRRTLANSTSYERAPESNHALSAARRAIAELV